MLVHVFPFPSPELDECAATIRAAIRAHWRREITFAEYLAVRDAAHAKCEPVLLRIFAALDRSDDQPEASERLAA